MTANRQLHSVQCGRPAQPELGSPLSLATLICKPGIKTITTTIMPSLYCCVKIRNGDCAESFEPGIELTLNNGWHPTPVLLPRKSHGWRSLVDCSPWGCEESDTTERLHFHFSLLCIGEGNPLQYSCLENPREGEAWWATVHKELDTTKVIAIAPHSSTLAWRIPWMQEPGRLQFMGSLRV